MIRRLLSENQLDGQFPVSRDVGPNLYAFLVDAHDIGDVRDVIRQNCESWGGGVWPLLPLAKGEEALDPAWNSLLDDATIDVVVTRGMVDSSDHDARLRSTPLQDYYASEPIWSILRADNLASGWRSAVARLLPEPDDPWFVAYLACFGDVAEEPGDQPLRRSGLRQDLEMSEFVDRWVGPLNRPGAGDLVRALRYIPGFPRALTLRALGVAGAAWSQDFADAPTWTTRHWIRQHVGANIAVVYEPGSVQDLCLIWNLRAAHALPRGLPLGIPDGPDVVAGLRAWGMPEQPSNIFAGQLRGFGRPFAITSMSVGRDRLEEIAHAAGPLWKVMAPGDLVQAPRRPARHSKDVAAFSDGQAIVAAFDRTTAELFGYRSSSAFGLEMRVQITVDKHQVPRLARLRGDSLPSGPGWRDGGFDVSAPKHGGAVTAYWPTGWGVLRAAVEPKGLTIRSSPAGAAAAALVERLGDFRELDLLRDPELLARLDDLARRRGISWFRNEARKLAALAAPDDASAMTRIEEQLSLLTLTGRDDEPNLVTVGGLEPIFKRREARAWVEWAERRGLLVRGIEIRCQDCGAYGWRGVDAIGPPHLCGGCGHEIYRPFPPDNLQFKYRPSQSLLEVMSADALPHLLCAGWFAALFQDGMVGVHPGVEFLDDTGKVVAEADVVVLLRDGSIGLVECKRRAAGLKQRDLDKLEELADALDAMFTCYATPQWADECEGLWETLRVELPQRRRFALFGEHLLRNSSHVIASLGVDVTDPHAGGRRTPADFRREFLDHVQRSLAARENPSRFEDFILGRQG